MNNLTFQNILLKFKEIKNKKGKVKDAIKKGIIMGMNKGRGGGNRMNFIDFLLVINYLELCDGFLVLI